jgi:biotin carboxylase
MPSPTRASEPRNVVDVTHVAVGFSHALLTELDTLLPSGSVLVLEEPDVIEARNVAARINTHPCVAGLFAAATQDEPGAERLTMLIDRPPNVRAVIPAIEYGVVCAAVLARAWGLPGAGPAAARTLRDKISMRSAADTSRLAQPAWNVAKSAYDVDEFRRRFQGRCVLKPANRQASLGVRLLDRGDDAEQAWRHSTQADEPTMRAKYALPPRFLVEQRLDGPEVSVEALVHEGQVGFTNITSKTVTQGLSPVEIGHIVPAALPPTTEAALARNVRELVRITGFEYGVLHSEWILVDDCSPHFIECAARLPGDSIDTLIDLAYGSHLMLDYLAILNGRRPTTRWPSRGAAAIRFLTAPGGIIKEVAGTERAAGLPGVTEVMLSAVPGTTIPSLSSSWNRLGHVIATGANHHEAAQRAAAAASLIIFDINQGMV